MGQNNLDFFFQIQSVQMAPWGETEHWLWDCVSVAKVNFDQMYEDTEA